MYNGREERGCIWRRAFYGPVFRCSGFYVHFRFPPLPPGWFVTFSFFFARSFSPFIHSVPPKPSSPSPFYPVCSLSPVHFRALFSLSIVRPPVSSFSFVASWFYLFLCGILFQLRATRTTHQQRRFNFFYEMKFDAVRVVLLPARTRYFRSCYRFQNPRSRCVYNRV